MDANVTSYAFFSAITRRTLRNPGSYVENSPMVYLDPGGLARLAFRGMTCGLGRIHVTQIPHAVFIFEDNTTLQYTTTGGIRPDPDPYPDYRTVYEPLDDMQLLRANARVQSQGRFVDGAYEVVGNNCLDYVDAVLREYAVEALEECTRGDVDACKEMKELCKSLVAPTGDVCDIYRRKKEDGKLPAHKQATGSLQSAPPALLPD